MSFETPQAQNRLGNIQALRGFAALMVMASHFLIIEQKYSPDQILPSGVELMMVGVDIFFAISGFIMVYVVMHRMSGPREMMRFVFSRASRIYPLYWLVSFALLLVYLTRPDLVFSSFEQKPNLIKSFLLWPDMRPPLLAVGWTLIHEMGFYLIFAVSLLFSRKFLLPFLVLWALVIAGGQNIGLNQSGPVLAILFSPLSYTFLLGALMGWIYTHRRNHHDTFVLIIAGLLWGVTLGMLISRGSGMIENHWGRFIHFGLPGALMVYGFASMKTMLPKFTQVLGDWSYSLYLTHVLSLSLMGRIWAKMTFSGPWDNILAIILMSVGAILISGFVHKAFEKPMLIWAQKARRTLWGG